VKTNINRHLVELSVVKSEIACPQNTLRPKCASRTDLFKYLFSVYSLDLEAKILSWDLSQRKVRFTSVVIWFIKESGK